MISGTSFWKNRLLLLFLLSIWSFQSIAQTTQIANPIIIPPAPQAGDSVFVRLRSATSGFTFSFGYSLQRSNDSFDIFFCVRQTPVPEPRIYDDTLFLGLLDTGEYWVRFTIYETDRSDSCTYVNPIDSVTVFKVSLATGIRNNPEFQGLAIYPNPCKDYFYINRVESDGAASVTLYNQIGQAVFNRRYGEEEANRIKMEVSKLEMGIYIVEMVSDRAVIRRKLEIVR